MTQRAEKGITEVTIFIKENLSMDYAKESLRLHKEWGGKIEVKCTVPCGTKDDLSLAYTPGVAQP